MDIRVKNITIQFRYTANLCDLTPFFSSNPLLARVHFSLIEDATKAGYTSSHTENDPLGCKDGSTSIRL